MPEHNRHYPDRSYDSLRRVDSLRFGEPQRSQQQVTWNSNESGHSVMASLQTDLATRQTSKGYEVRGPDGASPRFGSYDDAVGHLAASTGYTKQPGDYVDHSINRTGSYGYERPATH